MNTFSSAAYAVASTVDGADSPVLAVVTEDGPGTAVLERALAAAEALSAPVQLILVHPRTGFSTDPAVHASATRRRRQRLHDLVVEMRRQSPRTVPTDAKLVPYARWPLGDPARQAWRAAEAVANRSGARLVVAPQQLADLAAAEDVVAIVGVATPTPDRPGR